VRCGQHGVDYDDESVVNVLRHLVVILDGVEGVGVAINADVAHSGRG
jgi:hypothetical protein